MRPRSGQYINAVTPRSAATKIAHNSTIPLTLATDGSIRPLQDLITSEKAVLTGLQQLSLDFKKSAEYLRVWGIDDPQDDDLGDTTTAACHLFTMYAEAVATFAGNFIQIRDTFKSLRSQLESFLDLKTQARSARARADAVNKRLERMSPEHKNFLRDRHLSTSLTKEVADLDAEVQNAGRAISERKRSDTRKVLGLMFGGLIECCEKGLVVGKAGKMVASEISVPQSGCQRPSYTAQERNKQRFRVAQQEISAIHFDETLPSPLSGSPPYHHGPWATPELSPVLDGIGRLPSYSSATHCSHSPPASLNSDHYFEPAGPHLLDSSYHLLHTPAQASPQPAPVTDEFGSIQGHDYGRHPTTIAHSGEGLSRHLSQSRTPPLNRTPSQSLMRRPSSIYMERSTPPTMSPSSSDPSTSPSNLSMSPPGLSTSPSSLSASPPTQPASPPRLARSTSRASVASFRTAHDSTDRDWDEMSGDSHGSHHIKFPSAPIGYGESDAGVRAALSRFANGRRFDSSASRISANPNVGGGTPAAAGGAQHLRQGAYPGR